MEVSHIFSPQKKPLIGITCNFDRCDAIGITTGLGVPGQDWNYLAGDYVRFVEQAGGVPVIIPQLEGPDALAPLLDRLDGILISGGNDIGPERYGDRLSRFCGAVAPARDSQDIWSARYMACTRGRPVLGICRGMQILNVMAGGTLYQDVEHEGGFAHHFGRSYPRNVGWHTVALERGSLLLEIYGDGTLQVNSFHHQAVNVLGSGVTAAARSADGVVEAIELPEYGFAVGVQWHPEMMYDTPRQGLLARAFIRACGG